MFEVTEKAAPTTSAQRMANMRKTNKGYRLNDQHRKRHHNAFPPSPPSMQLQEIIIQDYCVNSDPSSLREQGCTVCGQLYQKTKMMDVSDIDIDWNILAKLEVTCKGQKDRMSDVQNDNGPVIDEDCTIICSGCLYYLKNKKVPPKALENKDTNNRFQIYDLYSDQDFQEDIMTP